MKTVGQVVSSKSNLSVHTIAPTDTVLTALQVLAEKNVGALPVAEADGRLVGIVSERDYARKCVLKGRSSFATPVSTIMSVNLVTVEPHQGLEECMQLMTDRHLRHLPVLEAGKLVGMLSIGDVVKELVAEKESLIQHLEQYIRGE
ncbi:CBS domain-containing protein [Pseudomonas stutzeri]|uniref:CBS domain-containing protein n=1 Tax=Stutzerimonas stutzeri TaxID=316 RepID=UPI00210D4F1E|nr:CBS domain-containing protein [Stutzerimonas stutzeri]MCQ4289306.1 CBS domain-containing protein [Stutzerimonas stutzeri]MCQ4309472.1 CBS domain-containing protein [Stutzerimonas stutzeri]